ncbi:Acetyl-CoA carboxylase (ACC) [Includes: Biotin carboxylase] [Durusdinium trenchii]|uniref:Acetyl-CoA carboxylase (ACC) n=1 Tax=Durusdinium trenchii TaxID=1381693 RepID=A0ABP0N374_9DINO
MDSIPMGQNDRAEWGVPTGLLTRAVATTAPAHVAFHRPDLDGWANSKPPREQLEHPVVLVWPARTASEPSCLGAVDDVQDGPGKARDSYAHFAARHSWREAGRGTRAEMNELDTTCPEPCAKYCLVYRTWTGELAEQFHLQHLPPVSWIGRHRTPVSSEVDVSHVARLGRFQKTDRRTGFVDRAGEAKRSELGSPRYLGLVFLATPQMGGTKVVHACLASHAHLNFDTASSDWAVRLESLMLDGMHELENAKLNPAMSGAEGRIFLHLTALADMDGSEIFSLLETFTHEFVARHGALIQGVRVTFDVLTSHIIEYVCEECTARHLLHLLPDLDEELRSSSIGLWLDEITIKVRLGSETAGCQRVLRFSTAAGEKYMKCLGMWEKVDPITGAPVPWAAIIGSSSTGSSGDCHSSAYSPKPPLASPDRQYGIRQVGRLDQRPGEPLNRSTESERLPHVADPNLRKRRQAARRAGSTYAPEFLGLLEAELLAIRAGARPGRPSVSRRAALRKQWSAFVRKRDISVPKEVLKSSELTLNVNGQIQDRTPEFPDGRSVVLIANDVTHQAGSFGVQEDHFFKKATEYARQRGLPRVYIACNSGARVGLVEEIMPKLRVQWKDDADPSKGFEYLYLTEADYKSLPSGAVIARAVPGVGYALEAVVGQGLGSIAGGIGVENLQGSGLIAGETSRAYQDIFTLSYVTGRSVGIGAYLNRLGQRVIQSSDGPLVLTGYSALNKLLGKNVYFSQDQLGGPQIMVPNGITHQLVQNDQEGAEAILQWLSFVPRDTWSMPQPILPLDPADRPVDFRPTKTPYDPRHMLAGTNGPDGRWLSGFFDRGSFVEYMAGWGRSVVVGRARLGGIPLGVIAVETRNVERKIPADPGNPESRWDEPRRVVISLITSDPMGSVEEEMVFGREIVEPQAGQVWFPDSAHKTATAIRDFNVGENLPLMIFANWRGFSGGTRDMYGEVLKFGAQIVDALAAGTAVDGGD